VINVENRILAPNPYARIKRENNKNRANKESPNFVLKSFHIVGLTTDLKVKFSCIRYSSSDIEERLFTMLL
jgi:hypothetical protein